MRGAKESEVIRELIGKIETAASFIENVNFDNIKEFSIKYLERFNKVSMFAKEMIEKYNIPLYLSPLAIPCYTTDVIERLLSATNEKEFIDALKQYAEAIEQWAKAEEDEVTL